MQFAVAVLALAAGVSANYPVASNTTAPSYPVEEPSYTTEVITSTEIYCPGPTTVTYGTQTYEVTEPTTLTVTDCEVTEVYPVYTTSAPVHPPVYPTVPVHQNTTVATYPVVPTGGVTPPAPTYPAVPTAAAGKLVAGMAGVLAAVAAAL